MTNESANSGRPPSVDRTTFQAELDKLRAREKAHTREGGRQEAWEDSPPAWPQQCTNTRTSGGPPAWPPVPEWPAGRPIPQWPRLEAGHSDDLTAGS